MERPPTRYARNGDVNIAYEAFGDGPRDIVIVHGYISHLDLQWDSPLYRHFIERLAAFARVIVFDKRGVGLSDGVDQLPTLEQRMEDVGVVMDAAGSKRAVLLGLSEGGMMCVLFAAAHPERTESLVLFGSMPRSTEAPGYPWASSKEALLESAKLTYEHWGEGLGVEIFTPSFANDPDARAFAARFERSAASPRAAEKLFMMFLDMDVRDLLPSVYVPTLVMHRTGDRVVNVRAARWMAEQIPGARFVEFPGIDHPPWVGDADDVLDEIEEFVTGTRSVQVPDRILATVMFTDIVSSTERAAAMGDRAWRDLLDRHNDVVRKELAAARGREIKTTGDGFLMSFDGPGQAIRTGWAIASDAQQIDCPVRVGVHTGECEKLGDDLGGIGVHIAARVASLADQSEVLVSRTVKDLVAGSGIAFEDRGEHTLKGVPDRWQLYAAVR